MNCPSHLCSSPYRRWRFGVVVLLRSAGCAALGDSGAFQQLQDCQQAMRKAVDEAAGAVLRSDSDGLTVAFASGAVALRCAIAVSRRCGCCEQTIRLRICFCSSSVCMNSRDGGWRRQAA
ncbi:MAG: hypothetical protein U0787_03520 [Polyangia bacterium]